MKIEVKRTTDGWIVEVDDAFAAALISKVVRRVQSDIDHQDSKRERGVGVHV